MSLRRIVPALVPSVTHSSWPVVGSEAWNRALPSPSATKLVGKELLVPGEMAVRRVGQALVASAHQRARPLVGAEARKSKLTSARVGMAVGGEAIRRGVWMAGRGAGVDGGGARVEWLRRGSAGPLTGGRFVFL